MMFLAETNTNWPAAVIMSVMLISICSVLIGKWPWQR